LGTNTLVGGRGEDVLIANRAGHNTLRGGRGDDLFILKESLVDFHGHLHLGHQKIVGGRGENTLRFIVDGLLDDGNVSVPSRPLAEFLRVRSAFDAAAAQGHPGTFTVDGLHVRHIDRIALEVDAVSTDPNTPYLITRHIVLADGDPPAQLTAKLVHLLETAEHWNLLTV
jgi:hypothetical protein